MTEDRKAAKGMIHEMAREWAHAVVGGDLSTARPLAWMMSELGTRHNINTYQVLSWIAGGIEAELAGR